MILVGLWQVGFLLDNGVMNYDATFFGRSGHCMSEFVRHTIETGGMFRFRVRILTGSFMH
jgi:hypothetical protein